MGSWGRVHDRATLDALEKMDPVPVNANVWRVTGPDVTRSGICGERTLVARWKC